MAIGTRFCCAFSLTIALIGFVSTGCDKVADATPTEPEVQDPYEQLMELVERTNGYADSASASTD